MTVLEKRDAKQDFEEFLKEISLTDAQLTAMKKAQSLCILPCDRIKIDKSPIEGLGVFASEEITPAEVVCPAFVYGRWTLAGRYANHSPNPNSTMVMNDFDKYDFVAIEPILIANEVTVDYRQIKSTLEAMRQ